MTKIGRIALWVIPFTWPLALWRSIKAGQRKRDAQLVTALGGTPPVRAERPSMRLARRLAGPGATEARVRLVAAGMFATVVLVFVLLLQASH